MEEAKPQKYLARVSEKYFLTESERFLLVKLELVKPDRMSFLAGQYVSLQINEKGERRSYSIASTPDENHGFQVVAEMVDEGKGSEFLRKIEIGATIEALAPLGVFTVSQSHSVTDNKLLFVATGSGIVPIWSMINDLLINKQEKRQLRLHWGMASEAEMFWFDNLERLAEVHPNFVFDLVLSKPSEGWELCRGHVQDCLRRDFSTQSGQGLKEWEGYVCGSQKMVAEIIQVLTELKMDPTKIYQEKFV
ncbi:MAG: FAD-binding oxidoreductase [bacterium]